MDDIDGDLYGRLAIKLPSSADGMFGRGTETRVRPETVDTDLLWLAGAATPSGLPAT